MNFAENMWVSLLWETLWLHLLGRFSGKQDWHFFKTILPVKVLNRASDLVPLGPMSYLKAILQMDIACFGFGVFFSSWELLAKHQPQNQQKLWQLFTELLLEGQPILKLIKWTVLSASEKLFQITDRPQIALSEDAEGCLEESC